VALTSGGGIAISLAYVTDAGSVDELVQILQRDQWTGRLFVGVVLDDRRHVEAVHRIDDAAADRRGRGQR
jgi:hypothetical protein